MFESLFSKDGVSLERLRKFCEIAEAGSIARAVENRGQGTQAAYSKELAKLEGYFDKDLFVNAGSSRSGKVLATLSPQGEALRQLTIDFFEGLESIIEFQENPTSLRIGAGESVLQWIISARMIQIRDTFPDQKIEMSNHPAPEVLRLLHKGILDVGIVDGPALANSTDEDLSSLPLGEIQFAIFTSTALRDTFLAESAESILSNLPLAGLKDICPTASQWQRTAEDHGYALRFGAMFTSFPQITQAIREGGMAGFLPVIAKEDMAKHGIAMIDHEYFNNLSIPINLVWNTEVAKYRPFLSEASSRLHSILREPSSEA